MTKKYRKHDCLIYKIFRHQHAIATIQRIFFRYKWPGAPVGADFMSVRSPKGRITTLQMARGARRGGLYVRPLAQRANNKKNVPCAPVRSPYSLNGYLAYNDG